MAEDTIKLNYFPHQTMDFFGLRNKAIARIQALASDQWTDYNEHDPGVTIVEQICYELTDLSYRTGFPVEDILAGEPLFSKKGQDTFFTISEIFPCHPETINDWRKLFLNDVEEIYNIWIETAPVSNTSPGGLFRIQIQLKDAHVNDREKVEEKVRCVFYGNRNVGEDIDSIQILKPKQVSIIAALGVDGKINPDQMLAQIFFSIQQLLAPPVPRYTITQLLKQGETTDKIFSGPLLMNGFIRDEDISPRVRRVLMAELINAVRSVNGVDRIYSFGVEEGSDEDDQNKVLRFEEDETPVLNADFKNQQVVLYINQSPVKVDYDEVTKEYNKLVLRNINPFIPQQNKTALDKYKVPLGRDRDLEFYRSVQFTFPSIYGVGRNSLVREDNLRKEGLALQLQGYLFFFDQMMANHLAQLAAVPKIFSPDPAIDKTYFSLPLTSDELPGLNQLLGYDITISSKPTPLNTLYVEMLDKIMKPIDPFYDRRSMFFDHLLSRFGIDIAEVAPEVVNWYRIPVTELQNYILRLKSRTLRLVDRLTKERGVACNIYYWFSISWYEEIVMLRLGIQGIARIRKDVINHRSYRDKEKCGGIAPGSYKSLAKPMFFYNILAENIEGEKGQQQVQDASGSCLSYVAPQRPGPFVLRMRTLVNLLRNGTVQLSLDMMSNGFITDNYLVCPYENQFRIAYFPVVNTNHSTVPDRKFIGTFATQAEANEMVLTISEFIRQLNLRTEGLHMVENVMLRTASAARRYKVEFRNDRKEPLMISVSSAGLAERVALAEKILETGKNHFSCDVHYNDEKKIWYFEMLDVHHVPVARSYYEYTDREKLNKVLEEVQVYFRFTEPVRKFIDSHCVYVPTNNGEKFPGPDFFSFYISVALPNWTSRFADDFFVPRIKTVLRDYAPAHLGIQLMWLNPQEMAQFEYLYVHWRTTLAESVKDAEPWAYDLAVFINTHSNPLERI